MQKRIAVIGAGASGCITAVYLKEKGEQVVLCDLRPEFEEDFDWIQTKGILVEGPGFPEKRILVEVTSEIESAMESELIFVCVSALRQEQVAVWMREYVRPEHKIFLMPGNLGSLVFHRIFQESGVTCELLAEVSECFWACRKAGSGKIVSAMPLSVRRINAVPRRDTEKAVDLLAQWFSVIGGNNVVENMLNSPNVLTHLAGTLLNIGEIERKGSAYALFLDGLSETYLNCLDILEHERKKVLDEFQMCCYGAPMRPFFMKLNDIERFPELKRFKELSGPDGIHHRYITEDAMCGVALLVSMAKRKQLRIPVTEALLELASSFTKNDFYKKGRTLDWIGMDWNLLV